VAGLTEHQGIAVLGGGGPVVRWAARGTAAPGETRSGDGHVVLPVPGGLMVGVVDALGHGAEAADVAFAAVAALGASPCESPAGRLRDCHRALAATRGAVLALARIDAAGSLTWTGVGNVEAVLLRPRGGSTEVLRTLISRPGVLGMRLPANLVETSHPLEPGDVLLMASDGVDQAFVRDVAAGDEPAAAVRRIIEGRLRAHDDALVVAARFEAPGPAAGA